MNDPITEHLAQIRDELFEIVKSHDICFEENSDECQFLALHEAAELIDQVVIDRYPVIGDGAAERKARLEDELAGY